MNTHTERIEKVQSLTRKTVIVEAITLLEESQEDENITENQHNKLYEKTLNQIAQLIPKDGATEEEKVNLAVLVQKAY